MGGRGRELGGRGWRGSAGVFGCVVAGAFGSTFGCIGSPGSSGVREPAPDCGEAARGDPSQLTTPIGSADGPAIDAPKTCDDTTGTGPGAYIRVHGHGQRRIEMGRDALARCTEPPATPTGCVFSDDFGRAVIARLGAQSIETIGLGLGVCGSVSSTYDGWNFSVSVHDWTHADAAIAAVDAELRARDVGHFFGVSVRGIGCAVAD